MIPSSRLRRAVVAPALAAGLLVGLVGGCGDGDEASQVVGQGPNRRNSADVEFATQMIPHHAQAVAMVNLTLGQKIDPAVAATAEQMLTSSLSEKLSGLLQDWGKPIPRTMTDHVGHAMGDTSMPGALTQAEFYQLEKTRGATFEREWLEAMIAHHEGAIRMARTERAEGVNPTAKRLAAQVIRTHQAELQDFRKLVSG